MAEPEHVDVEGRLTTVLVDQLCIGRSDVSPEAELEDLGVESAAVRIDLVMAIEDEFDIDVPDENMERFRTVGDVIAFIEATPKRDD